MALLQHNFTVAVDFGTSRSGFSYIFKGQDVNKQIFTYRAWSNTPVDKALTQILYDPKGKPIYFGYDVPREFSQLQMSKSDEEIKEYSLFKFFKMELRDEKNATKILSNPHTGRKFKLVQVIADYLIYIRKAIEKSLNANLETMRDVIRWCFTVPAIWTDKEKQLTKEACVLAGFIDDIHVSDEDFMFAPEPEAAACYCMNHLLQTGCLSRGETFLVVDAGGGTIDLTSHYLEYEGTIPKLKSMTKGGGGPWGASELDKKFIEIMEEEVFGHKAMNDLRRDSPMLYFELCDLWENKKLSIVDLDTTQNLQVSEDLKQYILNNNVSNSYFTRGRIILKSNILHKIYDQVLEEICLLISEEIDHLKLHTKNKTKEFHNIFVVGGFGESKVVQDLIRERFGTKNCRVTCPSNAGAAIVKGAVMLGLDPSLIMTRRMRRAYGINVMNNFIPSKHKPEKKINIGGRDRVKDSFDVFVDYDEEVKYDQIITREYYPLYEDQTAVSLQLFTSCHPNPVYTDEEGTYKSGEIIVDMTGTNGLDRLIEVSMSFGKSEIEVNAHDKTTGKKYNASLDFTKNSFTNKTID